VLHDVLFYFVGLFPGERNSRRGFSFKGGKCPWQINLSILWKIFPLFPSPLGTVLALAFSAPFSLDNNYLFDNKILIKKNT